MRVAYYSPLPPSRSGIADYSALLLPELGDPAPADDRLPAPPFVEALADPLLVVMVDATDLEVGDGGHVAGARPRCRTRITAPRSAGVRPNSRKAV